MSISKKNSEDKGADREHPHLNQKDNLVWLDMEMSGLDPNTCRILEIAIIVTDRDLNPLHEGIEFVLKQSDYFLNKMDDWNKTTHKKSGLIDKVKISSLDEQVVEGRILEYLCQFVPAGTSPLCGS